MAEIDLDLDWGGAGPRFASALPNPWYGNDLKKHVGGKGLSLVIKPGKYGQSWLVPVSILEDWEAQHEKGI